MPLDHDPTRIRLYRPEDLDRLYAICLQTADSGQDATGIFQDPRLPGHVYAAPYAMFEPSLAFVAEDAAGVGGYIIGALDSLTFERRLEQEWWPDLRARYPEPPPDQAERLSQPERFAIQNIHRPFAAPHEVVARFPSHLHVNLVPRMQGRGAGRQLMTALVAALGEHGSRGVHLLVSYSNQRARGFYRHIGFTELSASSHIFSMNLTGEDLVRG